MEQKKVAYQVNENSCEFFNNQVDFCVGTGRMGLALQKAYQEQLAMNQAEIGFKHIRGHGLFSDDMAIYQEYKDPEGNVQVEYNFTYLDMVMDYYKEQAIKPFLELGFMPAKMASGDQTVFYWKGNVTPPAKYENWQDLVQATLKHLMERYGEAEVLTWPIEVWNEPNLPGFWKGADMEEYFKLFQKTFEAVKELDNRFKIGGPAICGVDDVRWLREFLEFCEREKIYPDFITRHHYMFEKPDFDGHYTYAPLRNPWETLEELKVSRELIDSYPNMKGLPMHITEFNTSYSPDSPVHDTVKNASYIAWQLSHMGQYSDSYSYWTFGDIFEEKGVPFTPFHGGFGLVANGLIPKPTFWTFAFMKSLQGTCLKCSDELTLVKTEEGSYRGIAYNMCFDKQQVLNLTLELEAGEETEWCLCTKLVDEEHANPLKVWHDLGEPSHLNKEQLKLLRGVAVPYVQSKALQAKDNKVTLEMELLPYGLTWFEVKPVHCRSDRGFDYSRAVQ